MFQRYSFYEMNTEVDIKCIVVNKIVKDRFELIAEWILSVYIKNASPEAGEVDVLRPGEAGRNLQVRRSRWRRSDRAVGPDRAAIHR